MKAICLCIGLTMLCVLPTLSQTTDSGVFYEKPAPSLVPLRPIELSMGRFYYGGKKLHSAYSLEIPFMELNDPDVNRRFKRYREARFAAGLVSFVPFVYIVLNGRNGFARDTYWLIFGGSVAASLGLNFYSDAQARKAATLYNARLASRGLGFSVQPLPNGSLAPSLGYVARF